MHLLTLIFAFSVFSAEVFRPSSFTHQDGKAVFVDMTTADYFIEYDVTKKKAHAVARIKFSQSEEGYPVFDSVIAPDIIHLNGRAVSATEIRTPNNESTVRVLTNKISSGEYDLYMEIPLVNLVFFTDTGVRSSFWTSDLEERRFLESYLPTNLEFDQIKMSFNVKFVGALNKQSIYTNGSLKHNEDGTFKIDFPPYFTSSSLYFHVVPENSMKELRFLLKSIDGRDIPAVVYFGSNSISASLERLKAKTTVIFHELESDYGPFPHPSLTVYQAGMGGMEYCGATMTDFSALGHELFHSYFARGIMPANGNAGWIDEALASWRDGNYQSRGELTGTSGMSSWPYYTRTTDRAAYSFGERFMGYLDGKLQAKGGLKPFMRQMIEARLFKPFVIDDFINEMSEFYGESLKEDFIKYTFSSSHNLEGAKQSRFHQKMTYAELAEFL